MFLIEDAPSAGVPHYVNMRAYVEASLGV